MPSTTPNSIMHHPRFYAIKNLEDAQTEEQISTLFLRLNDNGLMGRICRARLIALQKRLRTSKLPTAEPHKIKAYKHNFASSVCKLMADRQVKFDLQLANDFGLPGNALNIADMLHGIVDDQPVRELAARGIYYAEQTLDEDSSLKSWNE
ncbi:hypothetical protein BX616_011206, partial [Lobosporangium transversale]